MSLSRYGDSHLEHEHRPGVVLLLSGGNDSAFLASRAPAGSIALFVNWGHPAAGREVVAARAIAGRFGLRFRRIDSIANVAPMRIGIGEPGPRIVGGRNLMLLSLAVSVACECGLHEVQIGCSEVDADAYHDCRGGFIHDIDGLAFAAYGVRVVAPLLHTPRATILAAVAALGIRTFSCYEPKRGSPEDPSEDGDPCGTCNACLRS
jgi:7-cyano-7-deazaguanine synthase in queuosine biosynthesis